MKNASTLFLRGIIVFILFLFIGNDSNAQSLLFLFGHLRYDAAPLSSDSKDNYNSGFGGEAGLGVGHDKFFVTGTIGYTDFSAKSSNPAGNLHYVPLKIGARYYLPIKLIFLNADLGLGFMNSPDISTNSTKFAADIGAGVKIAFFEALLNFDGISGYGSWFNIKAGISFGL